METTSNSRQVDQPTAVDLYLELLAGVLTRSILPTQHSALRGTGWKAHGFSAVSMILDRYGLELTRKPDKVRREFGQDFPLDAETMVGMKRLRDLRRCIEDIESDDVRGDLIETGVWRGGASIFMRGALKALGDTDRRVWVADSFEGMPATDLVKYPVDSADKFGQWKKIAVSFKEVQENFRRYGLLDDQVSFVRGWFKDSLPTAPIGDLAILRLDCDLYSSTTEVLNALYDKVSIGGYVIVDDYGIQTCRAAIDDFRRARGIADAVIDIDGAAARWRRSI